MKEMFRGFQTNAGNEETNVYSGKIVNKEGGREVGWGGDGPAGVVLLKLVEPSSPNEKKLENFPQFDPNLGRALWLNFTVRVQ